MAAKKRTIPRPKSPSRRRGEPEWVGYSDDELLELRFSDLGLRIEGTMLEQRIERLYEQLERRSLRFRPHCWLSDEWFSPDGIPGIAIPFYLAHPRLMRLEDRQMLEVEGGTQLWCMRILRHEAGHTLDTAFRLHRRRSWQQMFGKSSEPYPDHYRPKPYSKSFVLHLDSWYAQSHPAEDFAETFAVWLAPGSRWRQRYRGWPAMKKLEYVDGLMRELAEQKPLVTSRQRVAPLSQLKKTLREHYTERQERYLSDTPELFDKDLLKLFAPSTPGSKRETAAAFLRRYRPELRKQVAFWTSEYQYTVDQVLQQVITRCRQLKLRVKGSEARTKQQASMLLTVHTMNYLHHGYHRLAL